MQDFYLMELLQPPISKGSSSRPNAEALLTKPCKDITYHHVPCTVLVSHRKGFNKSLYFSYIRNRGKCGEIIWGQGLEAEKQRVKLQLLTAKPERKYS